ncbi:sulfurtransferase [Nocardioides sp.]|uniref:sulfurtransferase n=1 Tax=Nocardioides sp. TaxID=35761 RepID=UPI002B26F217|nr:sulfurtransferase [Nocardioides sp.]
MNPLISTREVSDLMASGVGPTILDVRYRLGGPAGLQEYAAGHVPTAAYVDLDTDLAAPPGGVDGGRHPLPDPAVLEAALRRSGVNADRPVVVYDDWQGLAAGRCWWLLRHHGHRDVRLLDGGWAAWVADGGAVETGSSQERAAGDFSVSPGRAADVVDSGGLLDVEVLVDARAGVRYRGEEEPVDAVAGHVPGARNVPTSANLGDDGRFRPVAELRELYAAVGAVPGADVAVYCGSGVTAVHDLIALELVGVRARLYPGSWSEWSADASRPVATGSECR